MAPFRFWLILSAVVLLVSSSATAANVSFSGEVTSVQSSYMPAFLTFSLKDANTSQPLGDATCPASWFFVFKDSSADKIKAMYATLLAATISGKSVTVIYDSAAPSDSSLGFPNCVFHFLYIAS
jgi:hypothetical protein